MFELMPFTPSLRSAFFDPFRDPFFDSVDRPRFAATDIRETDDSFRLECELPGFDKEDLHITHDDRILTIRAAHETGADNSDDGYLRRERSRSSFERRFRLNGVDKDGISAEYKNGLLTVTLPKLKPESPAQTEIAIC